jgi:murein DD-endopeptidase MepM/ murein hydrolase activator NlpD
MENNSLTDIVKSRRESREGIASSLGGALKEKAKEKLDWKRALPQGGLLTALFPKLTAYKAQKANSPTSKVVKLISSNLSSVAKSSSKIKSIAKNISGMKKEVNKFAKLENITPVTMPEAEGGSETTPSFMSKAVDFVKSNSTAIMIGLAIAGVGVALTLGFDKIKSTITDAFSSFADFGLDMFDKLRDSITGVFDGIKKSGGEIYDNMKDSITGVYDGLKDFGNVSYDKLGESVNSISDNIAKIKDSTTSLIKGNKTEEPVTTPPVTPPIPMSEQDTYTADNTGSADSGVVRKTASERRAANRQTNKQANNTSVRGIEGESTNTKPEIFNPNNESSSTSSTDTSEPSAEGGTGTTPSRNEQDFITNAAGAATGISRGPSRSPGTKGQATLGMSTTENQNQQLFLQAMNDLGVTDPKTRAAMAATVEGESGFKLNTEFDYSTTTNANIIKSFGKGSVFGKMSDEELTKLKADPAKFFDYVYGGRYGNTAPGDGYKYRGRGLIGITFKGNYEKYGKILGVDLVGNPDLANDPLVAAKIAVLMMKDGMAKNQGADIYTQVARSIGNANEVTEGKKKTAYERNLASGQFGADKKADLSFASSNSAAGIREGRGVGPGHDGIDIAAPIGTPVQATSPGKVIQASFEPKGYSGYGNIVVIESLSGNGEKIYTKYAHLSAFDVKVGDTVDQGGKIGKIGNTGRSSGPHLHYEMRKGDPIVGTVIDPKKLSLISPMDSALKQTPGASATAGLKPQQRQVAAAPQQPYAPQQNNNQNTPQTAAVYNKNVANILFASLINGSGY